MYQCYTDEAEALASCPTDEQVADRSAREIMLYKTRGQNNCSCHKKLSLLMLCCTTTKFQKIDVALFKPDAVDALIQLNLSLDRQCTFSLKKSFLYG